MPEMVMLDDEVEEAARHSRRSFLTRGAIGTAAAVAGGAAITALSAAPAAAAVGAVNAITPVRVYDSRIGQPQSGSGTQGIYTRGDATRQIAFGTVSPAVDLIPDNAILAVITLTVTSTVSSGALAATASATLSTSISTINWFGSGQTLANSLLVPVNSEAAGKGNANISSMRVHFVGGAAGVSKCNFIIDCSGYVAGS